MQCAAEKIVKRFPSKIITTLPFLCYGCHIEEKGGMLHMQQQDYARSILQITSKAGFRHSEG